MIAVHALMAAARLRKGLSHRSRTSSVNASALPQKAKTSPIVQIAPIATSFKYLPGHGASAAARPGSSPRRILTVGEKGSSEGSSTDELPQPLREPFRLLLGDEMAAIWNGRAVERGCASLEL